MRVGSTTIEYTPFFNAKIAKSAKPIPNHPALPDLCDLLLKGLGFSEA